MLDFLRRPRHERTGYELYGAAVAAARAPFFYAELGVPDTLDGRFDLVGLHSFLVIRRLNAIPPPGAAVAQALFDAMFSDMDVNLREMGVSDLAVGRRVRSMWEAFHGRAVAYQAALGQGEGALAAALARNVWRGSLAEGDGLAEDRPAENRPVRLARIVLALDAYLATVAPAALYAGKIAFPAPEALPT